MTDQSPKTEDEDEDEAALLITSETVQRTHRAGLVGVGLPARPDKDAKEASGAVAVQLDRRARRISVTGELDMATVPVLAEVLAMQLDLDPGDTTIDLSGVTFIDATGLGCLVDYATQIAALGAKVTVVGATPRARKVFDIVGLGSLLEPSGPHSDTRSADQQ